MTPSKTNSSPSRAQDRTPGARAPPSAETPGRSDAVEAETRPVSPSTNGASPEDHATRAPVANEIPSAGGHSGTPALRLEFFHQEIERMGQNLAIMQRNQRERGVPPPASDNGTSVLGDPSKPEIYLISVHSFQLGPVNHREIDIDPTSDVRPTNSLVGVVTRGN